METARHEVEQPIGTRVVPAHRCLDAQSHIEGVLQIGVRHTGAGQFGQRVAERLLQIQAAFRMGDAGEQADQ